jgi:pyrimidine deaminase RibD-like protein
MNNSKDPTTIAANIGYYELDPRHIKISIGLLSTLERSNLEVFLETIH